MKLQVQPYNLGGYNVETEETKFRTYSLEHEFNGPARAIITLADTDGSILRKYNVGNGAVGGAVADDGGVETDETVAANNDTADDMTLLPWAPQVNDAYYFGFARTFEGVNLNISTPAGAGPNWTVTWEYSTGADAWSALADVVDGTSGLQTGGFNTIGWTVPSDWATDTVGAIANMYWVRGRVSAYTAGTGAGGQQVWIEGIYLGVGKVTIEDPDGTDYFFGRIKKVIGDFTTRTVMLECRDWLDQLDEEEITYDMREPLSGNIRQSIGHADPDGAFVDVAQNAAGTFYFYDDAMAWANDAYNGMKLILTSGMAGSKTWGVGPYADNVDWHSAEHNEAGSYADLWEDDSNSHDTDDADADWEVDYSFRVWLGDNAPSDFYVHDSITAAKVYLVVYAYRAAGSPFPLNIKVGGVYKEIAQLKNDVARQSVVFDVPGEYVSDIVDANGIAQIQIEMEDNGNLEVYYVRVEVDTTTTGYSTAITINDTITTNKLEVATDLTAAATRVWEEIPYCIAQPMFKRIDSAEGGTLITGGDGIVTLTCAGTIEHTSGISTRQYVGKTRLHIAKDLARQDKSVLWLIGGTTTLTYKQTFGADTQQLTDGDVLDWRSMYDYNQMVNEYHVYGARIGDYEIYQSQQNAASVAKYNATRTKVEKRAGVVSDYEAKALATALVARDAELLQMVSCTIAGNTATAAHATTIKLGEIVEITSSYLWPTAAKDYIVTRFAYDSKEHKTYLTLHPKSSIGMQEIDTLNTQGEKVKQGMKATEADKFVADPITHEVS